MMVFYLKILKNIIYLCDAKLSVHQPVILTFYSSKNPEKSITG